MRKPGLIVIPSRRRPARLAALLGDLRLSPSSDVIVALDADDYQSYDVAAIEERARLVIGPDMPTSAKVNSVVMRYAGDYEAVMVLGDDNRPQVQGWDAELGALLDTPGMAYPQVEGRPGFPELIMVSTEIVFALGWLAHPAVRHFYSDNILEELGREAGCLRYAAEVVIAHDHPRHSGGPGDEVYDRAASWAEQDGAAYLQWAHSPAKAADLQRVLSVIR